MDIFPGDYCPNCGEPWHWCYCDEPDDDMDPARADPVIAYGPDAVDSAQCPDCRQPWEHCECAEGWEQAMWDEAHPEIAGTEPRYHGVELAPGAVFHVAPGIRPETVAALARMAELVRGGALS